MKDKICKNCGYFQEGDCPYKVENIKPNKKGCLEFIDIPDLPITRICSHCGETTKLAYWDCLGFCNSCAKGLRDRIALKLLELDGLWVDAKIAKRRAKEIMDIIQSQ